MNGTSSGSGKRERRHFTGQPKVAIVRQHLVDGADFLAWQQGFGTLINATHAMGDADGDGDVDADDLSDFNLLYFNSG